MFTDTGNRQSSHRPLLDRNSTSSGQEMSNAINGTEKEGRNAETQQTVALEYDPEDRGFRRIIRNFTPSYVPPHSIQHAVPTNHVD
jgi:hypothetical protein